MLFQFDFYVALGLCVFWCGIACRNSWYRVSVLTNAISKD